MKKIFILAAAALLTGACNDKPGFTITGTVDNEDLNGHYVYLYANGEDEATPSDSALVSNNAFVFEGTQDTPLIVSLRLAGELTPSPPPVISGGFDPYNPWFVLDNSRLTVHLGDNSTIKGSPENNELTAYMQQLDKLYDNQTGLQAQLTSSDDSLILAAEAALEALDAQAIPIHKAL
jgi:hypothetical protein